MSQNYAANANGGDKDNLTDRNRQDLKEGTPLRQSELKNLQS